MIRLNNNKAFFEENRQIYEGSLKEPLYALAADMEGTLRDIDPAIETRPQKAVARIRRSTRYRRDKSPYRDFLWIGWRDRLREKANDEAVFGFYFDMGFDGMSCGAGFHEARPQKMADIRRKIALQPERFEAIASAIDEKGLTLCGEDYKRVAIPDGLPPLCRKYFVKKAFYIERDLPIDERNTSPELVSILTDVFRTLAPLYEFIEKE